MAYHKETGFFERRRVFKNANFLKLTPLRQEQHETDNQGAVVVLIPKFRGWLSARLLQPLVRQPYIKLSLDELGSATWLLCNGNNTVEDICSKLKVRFGDQIHPAEDRVTTFLSRLYKDKIITFREITIP